MGREEDSGGGRSVVGEGGGHACILEIKNLISTLLAFSSISSPFISFLSPFFFSLSSLLLLPLSSSSLLSSLPPIFPPHFPDLCQREVLGSTTVWPWLSQTCGSRC